MTGNGPYTAAIKLISQPAPANLIISMQDVGFDYGMSAWEVGVAMVEGAQTLWEREIVFDVK